jgi:ketosteroid isomerase-like protein
VPPTPQQIFERYIRAGALTRDADALAGLFAPDGVLEAPLVPDGRAFPSRLAGRDEIRRGMAEFYRRPVVERAVDAAKTRVVLHITTDPDVFIAEIDTAFEDGGSVSLVQIFRVRDGQIVLLRDYFAPELVE